jgi:hypothetical protein
MKTAKDVATGKDVDHLRQSSHNGPTFKFASINAPSKDYYYDQLLSKLMQMNTKVWHPELLMGASVSFD